VRAGHLKWAAVPFPQGFIGISSCSSCSRGVRREPQRAVRPDHPVLAGKRCGDMMQGHWGPCGDIAGTCPCIARVCPCTGAVTSAVCGLPWQPGRCSWKASPPANTRGSWAVRTAPDQAQALAKDGVAAASPQASSCISSVKTLCCSDGRTKWFRKFSGACSKSPRASRGEQLPERGRDPFSLPNKRDQRKDCLRR